MLPWGQLSCPSACKAVGGQLPTKKDFERQNESRFEGSSEDAWEEALKIVGQFDRHVLMFQSQFFGQVYRPKRDELASRWSELSARGVVKPTTEKLESSS